MELKSWERGPEKLRLDTYFQFSANVRETRERLERDWRKTRERLERD